MRLLSGLAVFSCQPDPPSAILSHLFCGWRRDTLTVSWQWALLIVPPKHQRHQDIPESLLFKTLESETKSARTPVYIKSGPAVRDLDGEPLEFRSQARLNVHSCYFHSCCAMWKTTFLEQPDRPPQEFWEVFQSKMDDLWGDWANRRSILRIFRPVELYSPEEVKERELAIKASRALSQTL